MEEKELITPSLELEEKPSSPQNGHEPITEDLTEVEYDNNRQPIESEGDVVVFRRSHLYALLLPLAFVLGLSVGFLFWGRGGSGANPTAAVLTNPEAPASSNSGAQANSPTQTNPQAQANTQNQYQDIVRYDIPIDDDPVYGPEDAAITIIEFSDYECPFCRKWYTEVYQRLLQTYAGQIRFVYRDFPLTSIHPNAFSAAEAANCAGEQGLYWAYHDSLFGGQLGFGEQAYKQYAEALGLNMENFNACVESKKYQAEVQADFEFAAQLGVRSTPTFFINGIALVGAQPFEVFQQVIESELAGEIP